LDSGDDRVDLGKAFPFLSLPIEKMTKQIEVTTGKRQKKVDQLLSRKGSSLLQIHRLEIREYG